MLRLVRSMASSAGRFGRILRGVLLIGLLAVVASCSKTTVAGVLLRFETDGTLDPDTLHVTITASGRGAGAPQTGLDWCYVITNPATFFPTTLAIAPTGDPTETVSVTASVLRGGVTLDVRQNYLTEVPNDRVVEYDILFSGKCSAQVSSVLSPPHGTNCPYPVATSLCPAGATCNPATGMCSTESPDATRADSGDGSGEGGDMVTEEATTETVLPVSEPPSCVEGGPGRSDCGSEKAAALA